MTMQIFDRTGVIGACIEDARAYGLAKPTIHGLLRALIFDSGYRALVLHRFAHALCAKRLGKPIGLVLWQANIALHGCHLSPYASIGARVRFPHAIGVVIGSGAVVGSDTTIYQNVTVGQRSVDAYGAPRIGCGVVLYAGSVIVGQIEVGDRSVVGANVVVLNSIGQGTRIRARCVTE